MAKVQGIFSDEAATTSAGTYTQNNNTFIDNPDLGDSLLFVQGLYLTCIHVLLNRSIVLNFFVLCYYKAQLNQCY